MSAISPTLAQPLAPFFNAKPNSPEPPSTQSLIDQLHLQKHPEGGYYAETDRDPLRVPNPFLLASSRNHAWSSSYETPVLPTPPAEDEGNVNDATRSASTTIFYLLTPSNPMGVFHRNKARTMHTLHKGRGRYVIIHADEVQNGQARVETFVVGHDVARGERLQWMVEGGKYKASFLLPGQESQDGLLISETVVPGFEFVDHDFLPEERLAELVTAEQRRELGWLIRKTKV